MSLIELEADFFQHALGICTEDGMLTALHHDAVELAGIGEIEIPHHHETPRRPGAAAQVGMQTGLTESARGAVAEVADIDLSSQFEFPLDGLRIFFKKRHFLACFVTLFLALGIDPPGDALVVLPNSLEDLPHLLNRGGETLAEEVGRTGWHVELATADADAVLTTIALLRHQCRKHVKPV